MALETQQDQQEEPFWASWFSPIINWVHSEEPTSPWLGFVRKETRIIFRVITIVRSDEVAKRAAALTYHSLLALVPLLAVSFALFEAFGGFEKLKGPLEDIIYAQVPLSNRGQISKWISTFIENISRGAVAGVSVIVLFYTAGGLLQTVEESFNKLWAIPVRRPLYVRMAIYWCLLTLAPPLVALSVSVSTHIINETVSVWLGSTIAGMILSASSIAAAAAILVLSFYLIPDTRVPWKHALLSGVLTAIVWTAAKGVFFALSRASSSYSAIYGALSALPILMIWIYSSWFIVLFGVSYTRARGQPPTQDEPDLDAKPAPFDDVARTTWIIHNLFREGLPICTDEIARRLDAAPENVAPIIEELRLMDLLCQVESEDNRYLLNKDLGRLTLLDLWGCIEKRQRTPLPSSDDALSRVLSEADEARRRILSCEIGSLS